MEHQLSFTLLQDLYCVYRLNNYDNIPKEVFNQEFYNITRTFDELSIVCRQGLLNKDIKKEEGWKVLKVEGPLDFSLVGILSHISKLLADSNISIFSLSTYDTDYIMVKENYIESAIKVLEVNGHIVNNKL